MYMMHFEHTHPNVHSPPLRSPPLPIHPLRPPRWLHIYLPILYTHVTLYIHIDLGSTNEEKNVIHCICVCYAHVYAF